jgi:hypothetical protein
MIRLMYSWGLESRYVFHQLILFIELPHPITEEEYEEVVQTDQVKWLRYKRNRPVDHGSNPLNLSTR